MKVTTQVATLTTPDKIVALPDQKPQETRPAFTVDFEHRGRTFALYKRHKNRSAPYQVCMVRQGRRPRHSLETNDSKTAIDRAKVIIDRVLDEKWSDVDRVKVRRRGSGSLQKLFDLYRELAQVQAITIRNNIGSMRWLIECATGQK